MTDKSSVLPSLGKLGARTRNRAYIPTVCSPAVVLLRFELNKSRLQTRTTYVKKEEGDLEKQRQHCKHCGS